MAGTGDPKGWRATAVPRSASLRDALTSLEHSRKQVVLVIDEGERLVGVVTDGDIRRALLQGADLATPIVNAMNVRPTTAAMGTPRWRLLHRMREASVHHLPIVDGEGAVVDIVSLDELAGSVKLPNPVVLMAGGLGRRLESFTRDCPKPMLRVGNKPILESILESLVDQGFRRFYIAVHYRADVISEHFGDGSRWGVMLEYLREEEQLGTAGALSLLPQQPEHAVVVMNGDILTRVDVNEIVAFHQQEGATATMAVREFEYQVPYGVVNVDGAVIRQIIEKPMQQYLVNAGIYVLSPQALAHIPSRQAIDMPVLFERLLAAGAPARVFPVRDYWVDIGRLEELEKARMEWPVQ